MKPDFKIGDVVRLKSGGPRMTVVGAGPDADTVVTNWMHDTPTAVDVYEGAFPHEALEEVIPHG